jgi:hypothetical protein
VGRECGDDSDARDSLSRTQRTTLNTTVAIATGLGASKADLAALYALNNARASSTTPRYNQVRVNSHDPLVV